MKSNLKKCDDFCEMISSAFDGIIQPQETADFLLHLSNCAECREFLVETGKLQAEFNKFNGYFSNEKLSAGFSEKVLSKIKEPQTNKFDSDILDFEALDNISAAGDPNNCLTTENFGNQPNPMLK